MEELNSDKVSLFSYLRESIVKRRQLDSDLTTISKGETIVSNSDVETNKPKRLPYKYLGKVERDQ